MLDAYREMKLQKRLADNAFRKVFVVGYGFGLVTEFLSHNPKVKYTTTVEKNEASY